MCGNFAGPDLTEVEIDGARILVCKGCSKYGTKISNKPIHVYEDEQEETEVTFVKSSPGGKGPSISHVKVKTGTSPARPPVRQQRRRDDLIGNLVLVDDYGTVIKDARMRRGWSLEQFAQIINEKASMMQKIEKSEFNPPEALITKIQRKLDISLKEEASAPIFTGFTSKKETTLGDVVKLKKKKKE
ncbi:MAG: helix-turn-helix domain-containing protein [Candidatus Heimdallarchaeota archaeon]